MSKREQFIEVIDARRREMGLTHQQLAERAGTSRSQVSQVLTGAKPLGIDLLIRLANGLDLDLDLRPRRQDGRRGR